MNYYDYMISKKKNALMIVAYLGFLMQTNDCQFVDTVVNTSYEAPWTSLTFIIPVALPYNVLWSNCRLHSIYYCLNGFISDHGNQTSQSYHYIGTRER